MLFVATQVAEEFGQRLGEFLGVEPDTQPVFLFMDFAEDNIVKFRHDGEASFEGLSDFVQGVLKGDIAPHRKSQEVPQESHENFVRVLVGKNFSEVVMDESKDVLVEFYAPWCGHCKNLEPIYAELAEKLKDNDSVVIAKLDATANEISQVNI